MAVTAEDLTAPLGLIELSLFPVDEDEADPITLEVRLGAYIADAISKGSPSDEATKAYAYHRAFLAVYLTISADPESLSLDEQGSSIFHSQQAERFKRLSDQYLLVWNEAQANGAPGTNQGSGSVSNLFRW